MAGTTQQTREALAERLRRALGPRTLRWLAKELKGASERDPDLRGVTAAGLRNYFEAKRSAPLELIRAIADALGVDWVELATGRPAPDKSAKPSAKGEQVSIFEDVFRRSDPMFAAMDQVQRRKFLLLAEQLMEIRSVRSTHPNLQATAKELAAALRTPTRLSGNADPTESLPDWHRERYLEAFLATMRLGIPRIEAGPRGRPKGEGKGI
jgi:hypothetical protein